MKIRAFLSLLLALLFLLTLSCCYDRGTDTDPDWDMDADYDADEYDFSSLSAMEDYLTRGRLPDGIHKKLNRVFPLPVAGLGYVPFGELFGKTDGVTGGTVRNDRLWYADIDVLTETDPATFSACDFQFYYHLEGVRVMVTRKTSYVNQSAARLLGIAQVNSFNGFEGEDDALLRRCGDTDVVYLMSDGEISGAFVVICDRYIRIVADGEEGFDARNETIAPLFSTDDAVFEGAVDRMVQAVRRHSEVAKKGVSKGMSKAEYLKAVHGGAFIAGNRSAFLTKEGDAAVVCFEEGRICSIEGVALAAKPLASADLEQIAKGEDYRDLIEVLGLPLGVWGADKDTLIWLSAENDRWHVTFDEDGKVKKTVNWSAQYEDGFY